jgi:hypothetical protein
VTIPLFWTVLGWTLADGVWGSAARRAAHRRRRAVVASLVVVLDYLVIAVAARCGWTSSAASPEPRRRPDLRHGRTAAERRSDHNGGMDAARRRPDEALRSARRGVTRVAEARSAGRPGFDYLDSDEVYLDSACQTLRPQPVIDAVQDYLHLYACGGRVRYDAGRRVDAEVARVRDGTLAARGGHLAATRAPSR